MSEPALNGDRYIRLLFRLKDGEITDTTDLTGCDYPFKLAEDMAHDELAMKMGVYEQGDKHRPKTSPFVHKEPDGFWFENGEEKIEYRIGKGRIS